MIDLSQLPAPAVIELLDFEAILAARKARLISLFPADQQDAVARTLELESEPLTKLLQENAYRELILRQRVSESALAVMLAYATGSDLEAIAAHWNVERLVVQAGDAGAVPPVPAIMETDDRLRYRTQLAMESLTVAGTEGAYRFHALAASAHVASVSVVGPELVWEDGAPVSTNDVPPGMVRVYILSADGDGTPDADLLATVAAYLTDDTRRPLCDTVEVLAPEFIDYAVSATLYIYPGPSEAPVLAQANTNATGLTTANRRLGYDMPRSALFAALHVPGVQRVVLDEPAADIVVGPGQIARCTGIAIAMGGRDV